MPRIEKLSLLVVGSMLLLSQEVRAQCATSYNDGSADANYVYAWSVITDNYTDAYGSCQPGWGSFTHTYNINMSITSPSGWVANGSAYGSASSGSGQQTERADAAIAFNEEGVYTVSGNDSIDCSVAGTGFYQGTPVIYLEIRVKTTYYANTQGSQVIAGRRFCNYTAACSNSVEPACNPTATGNVPEAEQCPYYYQASYVAYRTSPTADWNCTISVQSFNQNGPGPCDPK